MIKYRKVTKKEYERFTKTPGLSQLIINNKPGRIKEYYALNDIDVVIVAYGDEPSNEYYINNSF